MEEFLNVLVEELKRNDDIVSIKQIPFLLSVLTQGFENNKEKYINFLKDIVEYPDYQINITSSKNDWSGIHDIEVQLIKYFDDEESGFQNYDSPTYHYLFVFEYDERNWGYCECSPEDKDYREDKHCCGHGCDWSAPAFDLFKVEHIVRESWLGDEHDYWDFEDEYYNQDKESNLKKKESERLAEIERLEATIKAANKRLEEIR